MIITLDMSSGSYGKESFSEAEYAGDVQNAPWTPRPHHRHPHQLECRAGLQEVTPEKNADTFPPGVYLNQA